MDKKNIIARAGGNACLVALYVIAVPFLMQYVGERQIEEKMGSFAPAVFLLLFVFSAAFMAVVVFGKPALLYLEGHKKEGVSLALATVGFIGVMLVIALAAVLLIV
jgi:hypothetical protein